MGLVRTTRGRVSRSFAGLLSDSSLTKKASLNAVSSFLDFGARTLVALLLNPLLVSGLGSYYYGMWQIAMRSVGYLSPASGRPTEALKWSLAHHQSSSDYEQKRTYVGSAVSVALLFMPLTIGAGAILTWFVPIWFDAPAAYYQPIRVAVMVLVVNMAATGFAIIPRSILQGENLAYKRMGLSGVFVFIGGGLTWLALYLDTGIVGVAVAALASTLVTGVFFLLVVRRYCPWFGVKFPPFGQTRSFLGLSFWFMVWNLVMTLMLSSDVIILGLFDTVEGAGSYTLTRYAPETTVMLVAMVVFGITPGLGGIIGAGDKRRAERVRGEIMAMTWLLATALCTTVLVWNRIFVGLWVGTEFYLGTLPTLFIVLVIFQFVLIRNDANIIDLTLRLPIKVILGLVSATLGIAIASVLVGYFDRGVVGLSVGLLLGRSILTFAYPGMIGRYLGVTPASQIVGIIRPTVVTALLFSLACILDDSETVGEIPLAETWVGFFVFAAVTFCALLGIGYALGLTGRQRRRLNDRVGAVLKRS